MNQRAVHVGIFGELDMNLIDGSSVWLQSIALTLAQLQQVHVTVVLRTPVQRELLVRPLRENSRITVIDLETRRPGTRRLDATEAVALLGELDAERQFDRVLLRGSGVGDAAVAEGSFAGRIWYYFVPVHGSDSSIEAELLRTRADACDRILCQTSAIAQRVLAAVPDIEGRVLMLPPMIPDGLTAPERPRGGLGRILYAGKFSPEYYILEMVSLFDGLRPDIPGLVWDVAGDKIHNPPGDPSFRPAVQAALTTTPGLVWHGGVSRERVHELLVGADVALAIRHPEMDASTELSTKVLEYGAAGCAALVNRNALHIELLGEDYPLLASDLVDARRVLLAANADPDLRAEAQRRCFEAAKRHTFRRVGETISQHLPRSDHPRAPALPSPARSAEGSPRLLIAGHQFNFMRGIRAYAIANGAAVKEDKWAKHVVHDEATTAEVVDWAEVIHCEWCLGAAIWCSRRRRDDQRLVVRFHRMELETQYPADVDLDRVDTMVFVAQHVLEAACLKYGWPRDHPSFRVVHNAVDTESLHRAKLPGAQFTLGLVGWVPMLKRLDLALDLLERLRAHDDRFRLIVKGNAPWDYDWMASRETEHRFYEAALARIERSPLLGPAVTFEAFGADIAVFLEKIGWILSLSDVEGHAVAPIEGMASGAVPVILDRPGASDQYPEEWVYADPDAAARAVLGAVGIDRMRAGARRAVDLSRQYSWSRLAPVWHELLALNGPA
ncbi:MAG: hypothetical protein WAL22_16685 [Solirubrobacteraceae bacterium]